MKHLRALFRQLNEKALQKKGCQPDEETFHELKSKFNAVGYSDGLAELKGVKLLGPVLLNLAADGQTELISCITELIKPADRLTVFKYLDRKKRTLIHCAAEHGKVEVIEQVLTSLSSAERLALLLLVDTSDCTALDHAVQGEELAAVSGVLLDNLSQPHQQELIKVSENFKKVALQDEDLIGRINSSGKQ